MSDGARRWIGPLTGVLLFAAALFVLRRELQAVHYHELTAQLVSLPLAQLAAALLLTAANYAVLTGYDHLALAYVGRSLPRGKVTLASFVAYAVANSVGFGMISGASVRYRFYSRWGVTTPELSRIVLFYSVTFWLGLMLLGGWSLALHPMPGLRELPGHGALRLVGGLLLALAAAYATLPAWRRRPLRLGRLEVPVPSWRIVAAQFTLSALDWVLAAAVLHMLLPPNSFVALLGAFVAAQVLGIVSHVPGGLGVFESAMVVLLKPALSPRELLPALVLFRVVYYVVPLIAALLVLVADEVRQRRDQAARFGAVFGSVAEALTPRLLAVFTFLGGAVLLFSGATPAAAGRLHLLRSFLPLAAIETSHFIGSLAGVGLLVLSQGIARRLDFSYYLSVSALVVGFAASLLKGGDYEEALLLVLVLLALVESQGHFDRKAAFFATRFSAGCVAAVVSVVASSVWLGAFAFRHVELSSELWWQFEFRAEASRFLRASVGAAVALAVFGMGRLLRPAPHEVETASDADLDRAARIIETQASTVPYLVFLRDKGLMFDEGGAGFVMYGVQGSTWVALGDPVGPEGLAPRLAQQFLERCDDFDGTPVFYEVSKERLHVYVDFGLTFVKLGEEARVPLAAFSLEGGDGKAFRQALRRLEKEGCAFRVVPAGEVPELIDGLEEVSSEWLRSRGAAEKGFSLGFFDRSYLSRFPVAVVERSGRLEAFANLWPGPGRKELSIDLMRYRESAPRNVMESLLVHLMLWGKEQGYGFFALGMAPLSGLDVSPVAPLWARLGSIVYKRGEALYNFQGLRTYKEKFHPAWEPRYLAYPGGLSLPRILADVSALVAGGYRRIFAK